MKNKKQKTISKIICTALAFFVFMLNSGAAQVAYAAPKATPPPKVPEAKCDSGWAVHPDDSSACYIEAATGTCKLGYHKINYLSGEQKIKIGESEVTKTLFTCGPDVAPSNPGELAQVAKNIQIIAGLQHMLNRLIWPVLILIGGLMENDLLFGNGMEEKLREIWIPMRNLVNILFVIVLVGLALYNVLGLAEDNTSIKSMLPKIVVGIIAVNFSFVAIKVMLDGINVLTTSIFALPGNINEELAEVVKSNDSDNKLIQRFCVGTEGFIASQVDDLSDKKIKQEQEFKTYHKIALEPTYAAAQIKATDTVSQIRDKIGKMENGKDKLEGFEKRVAATQDSSLCSGRKLTAQGKIFLSKYNSRNAAFALALNMGKIVFYEDVKVDTTPGKEIEGLFTNALFSAVLYLVYAASFIALFAVLLGRLVVMWLSIAVSPILLLMIASPTLKEKMGGLSKLSEQFTKNAIAPILIALSLTVGWIMLRAVQGLDFGKNVGTYFNKSLAINIGSGVPVASLNTLQDFVVALGVIAVVWMGVFSAAEGTVAQFATDFIKDKLQTAGKWVGSLPFKHMPMVPIQLPGHPHQTYTMSAVNTFLDNTFSSHREDNKLWEHAGGGKLATAEDFRTIGNDQSALFSQLRKGADNGKLTDADWRKELGRWKTTNGKDAYEKLDSTLRKAIDTLSSDKPADSKEVNDAVEAIRQHDLIRKADTTAPATTPPAGPAAPTAPGTPPKPAAAPKPAPAITKDTQVGGKPLGETLKDTTGKPNTAKINTLNKSRDKLALTVHNKGKDTEITAQLTVVGQDSGGAVKSTADLKSIGLTDDQIVALQKALPDITNPDGTLKETSIHRIEEALNPTPPTN